MSTEQDRIDATTNGRAKAAFDDVIESTDSAALPIDARLRDDLGELREVITPKKKNPTRTYLPLAVVVMALGFVLFKGLGSATSYFLQVDEAVARVNTLKERPFRLQGIVTANTIKKTGDGSREFDVEFGGKTVHVLYPHEPEGLFRENIAVVISGRFAPNQAKRPVGQDPIFLGDQIAVKHDENYIEKNSKRLKGAVDDPAANANATNTTNAANAATNTEAVFSRTSAYVHQL
jgi:cytochrome c-type biogenesis protein CcmE